jgi:hypothetical protein
VVRHLHVLCARSLETWPARHDVNNNVIDVNHCLQKSYALRCSEEQIVDCVRIYLRVILFGLAHQHCGNAGMRSVTSLDWLTLWWCARTRFGTYVYIIYLFSFFSLRP